jgi:hypothetical protein
MMGGALIVALIRTMIWAGVAVVAIYEIVPMLEILVKCAAY